MYSRMFNIIPKILDDYQVQWLMPVILATWKVEIQRVWVRAQPGQKVLEIPSQPRKAECGAVCLSSSYVGIMNRRIKESPTSA
jgi:hypothetical protein